MSDTLLDLDFETTAQNPNSNEILPLGTEALIIYNSPSGEKRSTKNQTKENTKNDTGSLFDDLGIKDHTANQQTNENSKPLSDSEILKKFSSPPHPK
ncbi:hypothetical protein DDB_G0293048 [Dictyostelium discoideum AX4]|uniref:Uncharacterized protein DDB_G0293048 n=1 Tax=Dictyostelium discoideum TaxID=44689 RepID=Y1746_DICDI|nr:hypothetical protein DDB_G0293048 [Dictyostelium discoideum AX4]Q54CC7.1 RecName: Full=Uncharacterized protein DDB_G0293048 [Dictyostelium discoideum]EAL60876.1 hypothetical protein DDB_G0293048 [Dictyostelium discoideum AX4]|eukprot:XP_629292.1 hypothetical protein DDB_G0293048 [Dictyostelium discoideum AX4]